MNYKISGAVCTGSRHEKRSEPGQDRICTLRRNGISCAALADGAGSRRSGGEGAETVIHAISELLCNAFDTLWTMDETALADTVLQCCCTALQKRKEPLYDLASTLLFCAGSTDGRLITGHLGDGVQILTAAHGESRVYSAPENGSQRNETWFVTSPDALKHLRLKRQRVSGSAVLLLMSDGMMESLYQYGTKSPAPACRVLADWMLGQPEEKMNQILYKNIQASFREKTDDDLSILLFSWEEETDNEK